MNGVKLLGYWPGYRMNRAATALTGAANLIVAEAARREGCYLSFGLPLTLVTLLLAYAWIYR